MDLDKEKTLPIWVLADEVLADIASFLSDDSSSRQLLALYLCGSRALNDRLCRGMTTYCSKMSESWEQRMYRIGRPVSFPVALLRRLRTLELTWQGTKRIRDNAPPSIVPFLQSLSPTLTEIRLYLVDATSAFVLTNPKHSSSNSTHNPSDQMPDGRPVLWNVAESFPMLQSLELYDIVLGSPFQLFSRDLAMFPASLRTLHWQGAFLSGNDDFSLLPLSLTSLGLQHRNCTVEILQSLPPSITHFGRTLIDRIELIGALPKTLKTVPGMAIPFFTPEFAAALPHHLAELNIWERDLKVQLFESLNLNWASCFPKSLTLLSITTPLNVSHIAALPRTLLEMWSISFTPHTMAKLAEDATYHSALFASKQDASPTESSHAHLEKNLEMDSTTQFMDRSTAIESISASTSTSGATNKAPRLHSAIWPPCLHTLGLAHPLSHAAEVLGLPQSLTRLLDLCSSSKDSIFDYELPPRLTELTILNHKPQCIDSLENALPLPRGLTSLSMGRISFGDSSLSNAPYFLPDGLKILLLTTATTLNAAAIASLSRRLVQLRAGAIESFETLSLPPLLTHLEAHSLHFDQTTKLPSSLNTLILHNTLYRDSTFQSLPPSLSRFEIRDGSLSVGILRYIPDSCRVRATITPADITANDLRSLSPHWISWIRNLSPHHNTTVSNLLCNP